MTFAAGNILGFCTASDRPLLEGLPIFRSKANLLIFINTEENLNFILNQQWIESFASRAGGALWSAVATVGESSLVAARKSGEVDPPGPGN